MTTTPAAGTTEPTLRSTQLTGPQAAPTRAVTFLVGTVVALTFLFGFGNVLTLGLHLGVPLWVAPLVAPAVDLSVIALLIATRHLALHHGPADVIRSARHLLLFASLVTLALNVAEPVLDRSYGLAAFDTVGPLLLIGWAHTGPNLLHAMKTAPEPAAPWTPDPSARVSNGSVAETQRTEPPRTPARPADTASSAGPAASPTTAREARQQDLLHRARAEDALHWHHHHRPISSETLRRHLRIGTRTARTLIAQLRADTQANLQTPAPPPPGLNGHAAPAT